MHYFIGMEVWKGKYAVEILNRFRMMDCMTTLMASNLKLLSDASSETVDDMLRSLMYLRPDICFAMNTLRHVHLMIAKHVGVQVIMGSSMM